MDDFLARHRMTNFGPRNGFNPLYFYGGKDEQNEPAP
jgi:hypothetical protein